MQRPLTRVIFDWRLRVPPEARVFSTLAAGPVIMVVSRGAALAQPGKVARLEHAGVVVERADRRELAPVLRWLAARDLLSLLVEGGPRLHAAFLAESLVDRVQVVTTPHVLGQGIPAASGIGPPAARRSARAPWCWATTSCGKPMFTGLIEAVGRIERRDATAPATRLRVVTALGGDLRPGESIAVNGVCLTVTTADAAGFDAERLARDAPRHDARRRAARARSSTSSGRCAPTGGWAGTSCSATSMASVQIVRLAGTGTATGLM